jgi:hypothetical protein
MKKYNTLFSNLIIAITLLFTLVCCKTGNIKADNNNILVHKLPANKKELLELSEFYFNNLLKFIESLPDEAKNRIYSNGELDGAEQYHWGKDEPDKRIADVICHLHEWNVMMKNWYRIGMSGKIPAMPAEDVTWQNLPVLNHRIYLKYKETNLKDAIELFKKSYKDLVDLVEKHSDEELFSLNKYEWTGKLSLGALFTANMSEHYYWGLKTVKPLEKQFPSLRKNVQ